MAYMPQEMTLPKRDLILKIGMTQEEKNEKMMILYMDIDYLSKRKRTSKSNKNKNKTNKKQTNKQTNKKKKPSITIRKINIDRRRIIKAIVTYMWYEQTFHKRIIILILKNRENNIKSQTNIITTKRDKTRKKKRKRNH